MNIKTAYSASLILSALLLFGMSAPIAFAAGPVFIDTNANGLLDVGEQSFSTITAAFSAAAPSDIVYVSAGSYVESPTLTKALTLQGGAGATLIGKLTIAHDSVTVTGLTITNPAAGYGLLVNNVSHITVTNNTFTNIGTDPGYSAGSAQAVYVLGSGAGAADITISGNTISGVGNTGLAAGSSGSSAKGIYVGDSNGTVAIAGVVIQGNTISNIRASSTTKGAYGILVNHGTSASGPSTTGLRITNNTISDLAALWAHGIGLEGNTPGAIVTGNSVSHVVSSGTNSVGLQFEQNTGATSVTVTGNAIDTTSTRYGVVNVATATPIDVSHNYWATSTPATTMSSGVLFSPWYMTAGMTTLSTTVSGASIVVTAGDLDMQKTAEGAGSLPAGSSSIVLNNSSVLNVASSLNTAAGGSVVIGGVTTALASFTSGSLTGVNLGLPISIGDQPITVGTAVQLSSGSNGVPIAITNSSLLGTSVSIPYNTTVLGPSGWNGTIAPPRAGSSAGTTAPSGFSVGSTVIDVGSPDTILLFDKPVMVALAGVTGSVGYRSAGSTLWRQITAVCAGGYNAPTLSASAFPGECAVTNGTDTKILTYHFTTFGGLTPTTATLHVIKLVVNGNGSTGVPSDFIVHVKSAGSDVVGSPSAGAAAPGTSYTLGTGTYVISESANASYTQTFSTDCDSHGSITLSSGDDKICTIINTDVPLPPVVSVGGSAGVTPRIGILKVPSPLALPNGPGPVTYNYTVSNIGGPQALTEISLADDTCRPVIFLSGDANGNGKLDASEKWKYSCTMPLATTTTNTAVVTARGDDTGRQTAIATAISTVTVGSSAPTPGLPATGAVPPIISIVKVSSRLSPFPFGGGDVMYMYVLTNPGVVPVHDVLVTDDKCAPISNPLVLGDSNGNGLLDPGETWFYTCRNAISVSTRSVATAIGKANGLTAVAYAFDIVLVTVPSLPDTGLVPKGSAVANSTQSLKNSASKIEVAALQTILEQQGFLLMPAGVDKGFFGYFTGKALAAYQKSVGLPSTGVFGPLTRAKLNFQSSNK